MLLGTIGILLLGFGFVAFVMIPMMFRRVVPTNQVHIVQSRGKTISYGKDTENGNVYYEWPYWIPVYGVTTTTLPVSNFDLSLHSYEAYDKGRVPFVVDVTAFFRIADTNLAAQRVESLKELSEQLSSIVQGAVRTILASHEIDNIMLERSTFGEQFTKEVQDELKSWGVVPVKNMELMDIRDGQNSNVIKNIMAKKKSLIEKESRIEVAKNMKDAEQAEIDAKRDIDLRDQEAKQLVGQRTAEQVQAVGIANEKSLQEIKEQAKLTAEKDMAVKRVNETKAAEIAKEVQIVKAQEQKEKTIIIAQGELEAEKNEAEGVKIRGEAEADAKRLMETAPVEAQIVLAKEIGENEGYQSYLVKIREVEAQQAVGIAQAKALETADLKVIANSGDVANGVNSLMDLFTSKGGTNLAAMAEAFGQTPAGNALLNKVLNNDKE